MTEKKEIEKVEEKPKTIRAMLEDPRFKQSLVDALPETGCTPERFARVALTMVTKNPKLAESTQASVAQCMMDCAMLGIEPDGRRAHLIPFFNKKKNAYECTLILDYKGIVELVRRSGDVVSIQASVVYEGDHFVHVLGTTPLLEHSPTLAGRGKAIAAYSCVTLKDGAVSFEVMGVEEINVIRNNSKGYKPDDKQAPWNKWWGEMARKTVFKRHSKWLTLSPEVHDAITKDDERLHPSHEQRINVATPVSAEEIFNPAPVEERKTLPDEEAPAPK